MSQGLQTGIESNSATTGNITAAGSNPANPAAGSTVTSPCLNASNYMAVITGTWVGTLVFEGTNDNTNWTKTNYRQVGAASNAISNTTTSNGTFRGNCSGFINYRVRATAWTSGTATVTLSTSNAPGAVFINAFVETQSIQQYYASSAGGNVLFGATSGAETISSSGGNIALLQNPANSTKSLFIYRFSIGSNTAGRITRYRNGTPSITGAGVTETNRGGGSNTSLGQYYTGTDYTITSPIISKVVFLSANSSDTSTEDGSIILPPGDCLHWYFDPNGNSSALVAVEVVWWEV